MGNQQLYNLTNETLQILLSGKLGDGSFLKCVNGDAFTSNCIHKEYIDFKCNLISKDIECHTRSNINMGYKKREIHHLSTKSTSEIKLINHLSIEETMKLLDDFGLALWIYDDGSLHKTKLFYNICTHSFTREIQEDIMIPILKSKWDINAQCIIERKKDGREFWYLIVRKYHGARIITELLSKIELECFKYKLWSSTTIQLWSKFQEELKSRGTIDKNKDLSTVYAQIWRKVNKSIV